MEQGGELTSKVEEWESRLLTIGLVIAIGMSLVDSIWGFLNTSKWIFPLIFLTFLIFLRWLDITRKKVVSIAAGAPLRTYDSAAEFYGEALPAVAKATKSVYAVFTHSTAPIQHTAESRRYYEGTLKWARKSPGQRALHRVIRLPASSPDVQQWVDEQIAHAGRIENYHVRVLRYPPGLELEGENFAVIDASTVFLGFAIDDQEELRGFSIRDERVARAFEQHFWDLWRLSRASSNESSART